MIEDLKQRIKEWMDDYSSWDTSRVVLAQDAKGLIESLFYDHARINLSIIPLEAKLCGARMEVKELWRCS